MEMSIGICIGAFVVLIFLLRRDTISLGLPVAYLFSLLLIHVPGAYVHLVTDFVHYSDVVEIGIWHTAIGSVSFVAGVWAIRAFMTWQRVPATWMDDWKFSLFCLFGGWLFTYGLSPLQSIPSLGAAVERAGAIWMLGVMLGLRSAVMHGNVPSMAGWLVALAVYPVLMLLLGGFISYGSAAVIVVLSVLTITVKGSLKVAAGLTIAVFLGINVFINYFGHRKEIRNEVWGGAPLEDRIDATLDIFREFKWFDPNDREQAFALDQRLNQNYFAGLAAARIEQGSVNYLYGRSVWEGVLALVPRAFWPEKPVFGGSPKIVAEMTGLRLNPNTSFGVGNVMEFHINFGIPGVVGGFFLLGFLIRAFDRKAAAALRRGDFGNAIVGFLPAVALIQPNGSVVELCGGSAAAIVGAYGWKFAWHHWSLHYGPGLPVPRKYPPRRVDRGVPPQ
jgi:hypothetical protein